MTRITGVFCAVLCLSIGTALSAQDKGERLRTATVALADLTKAVSELPAPAPLSRNALPLPDLAALELGRKLSAYMKDYADLPLAFDAAKLFAKTALVSNDGAFAAAALEWAAKHGAEGDVHGDLLSQAAAIRAAFGDYPRALSLAKDLLVQDAKHPKAGEWQAAAAEWTARLAEQDAEYADVKRGLAGVPNPQALFAARRFVQSYPMRAETATVATAVARAAEKTDLAQALEYTERVAYFSFGAPEWGAAAERAASVLGREGEYERAYLYTLRLIENAGAVSGLDVPGHQKELATFEKRWKAILARSLDVTPKTKRVRFDDLERRAKIDIFADALRSDLEDFETDYPTATETTTVRFRLGKSLAEKDPDTAIAKLKAAADGAPNSPLATDAILLAASLVEKGGDAENAAKLLLAQRQKTKDIREKLRLGVAEVHARERAGDGENAQKLVEELKKSAPEDMKKDLDSMLSGAGDEDDATIP